MTTKDYLKIYNRYNSSPRYLGRKEDLRKIRSFNKHLIKKYPWLMPLIVISCIIGIILIATLISKLTRDPYKADRGFYGPYRHSYYWLYRSHYRRYRPTGGVSKTGTPINPPSNVGSGRGYHGGGGCACACACACAGGGRAGCSMKDFYHTNIRTEDLKEEKA